MKIEWGCIIPLTFAAIIVVLVLTGCSAMPSMQYCDTVWYSREGRKVHIEADCTAPMGSSIPGL
jgi:hypothetical protein